ncbi:myelin-oligodendrocyte glycoprotein-like isoform 2-T2 [Pholidichthys leucotaenia]
MLLPCLALVVGTPVQAYPRVIGPSQPIEAFVGDDVLLQCLVEPPVDEEELTVEWWRPDLPFDPWDPLRKDKYVHRNNNGLDEDDMKIALYLGRTELDRGGLKNSNVSLKIMRVEIFDSGIYACFFENLRSPWRGADMMLIVEPKPAETTMMPTSSKCPPVFYNEKTLRGRRGLVAAWVIAILMILVGGGH